MIETDFIISLKDYSLNGKMKDQGLILLSGENGSGKSTFLKVLSGLIPPQSGIIKINNVDVTTRDPGERKVVYATQNSYFSHLSVQNHILWPMGDRTDLDFVQELKDAFGITFDGKLRDLSMGQRMRVTLATAFASRPRAILLDEVISNISNPEVFLEEVKRLSIKESIDIVFVAHSLGEEAADHHYNMVSGKMSRLL